MGTSSLTPTFKMTQRKGRDEAVDVMSGSDVEMQPYNGGRFDSDSRPVSGPHVPPSAAFTILALTYVGYVAFNVVRKTTSVVKVKLRNDLGMSDLTLGAMDTAFLAAYTVGQVVLGRLGDTLGPRAILIGGLLGSAVCTGLCGVTSSSPVLVSL